MVHKDLKSAERRALKFIRNRLVHGVGSPSVREVAKELGYRSPRSAALLIDGLIELGYLKRRKSDRSLQLLRIPEELKENTPTIDVPLVGSAPCGVPMLALENLEATIPVSTRLVRPPHRYFLLRAIGNSMTEVGIGDGNLVLVRQQAVAEDGDVVVALVDDEATIKQLRRSPDAVVLVPKSNDPVHRPIVLDRDFSVQGVVVATIPDVEIVYDQD